MWWSLFGSPRAIKESSFVSSVRGYSRVEAGSNTSTVALRVVKGDEKGSLESETVKYCHDPTGLGPENNCAGEGQEQL
jgi:hypothetical protein